MKKTLLSFIFFLFIGCAFAQETTPFVNHKVAPKNLASCTLLVYQFAKHDTSFYQFNDTELVNKEKEEKWLEKENKKIDKYNKKLEKLFFKHYSYSYMLVDEKEVAQYDSTKYQYAFDHYVVKKVGLHAQHRQITDFYLYAYFMRDRKNQKVYKDINFYSRSKWRELRVIIQALNEYTKKNEELRSNVTSTSTSK